MGRWKGISAFWIYLFIFDVCDVLLRMYEINLLRDEDTMFFGPQIGIYIYFELTLTIDVLNYRLKEWISFKTFWVLILSLQIQISSWRMQVMIIPGNVLEKPFLGSVCIKDPFFSYWLAEEGTQRYIYELGILLARCQFKFLKVLTRKLSALLGLLANSLCATLL